MPCSRRRFRSKPRIMHETGGIFLWLSLVRSDGPVPGGRSGRRLLPRPGLAGVMAPGMSVMTSFFGDMYGYRGTSFAAPLVSCAAPLVRAAKETAPRGRCLRRQAQGKPSHCATGTTPDSAYASSGLRVFPNLLTRRRNSSRRCGSARLSFSSTGRSGRAAMNACAKSPRPPRWTPPPAR